MSGMFYSLYQRQQERTPEPGSVSSVDAPEQNPYLDFPATYFGKAAPVNLDAWRLQIDGCVKYPQAFTYKELTGFMRIQQNRRLVFADGWTYRAAWEGYVISEILHRVEPLPEAQYLIQANAAGQVSCLPLADLFQQRALFSASLCGQPLPPQYGGPLRLMVFDRYAHHGLGQLTQLTLSETPVESFFEKQGYGPEGRFEAGDYYAADLKERRFIQAGQGELPTGRVKAAFIPCHAGIKPVNGAANIAPAAYGGFPDR